ncbi:MAG TPA: hypothetical protein VK778_07780 [Solirubrobacteraceae bacterium]|jgi:hypothetical protein|nr:hypothetical protein [Solirubrobacteraceae bacterium]
MKSHDGAGLVMIFGESDNDRKAIATLVRALCPKARTKIARSPLVLIKNASPSDTPSRADRVAAAVRAVHARDAVRCVLAHEDADATEPAHESIAERIERTLRDAGTPGKVHAVVPAWEIEAWWFMWPEVVATCYKRWVEPRAATPPGRIENAKERLARAVRPSQLTAAERKSFPEYRESDSIRIAEAIAAKGAADEPALGVSGSYDRFRASVADCCS